MQSKSVGGFLRESPLDNVPRRPQPTPQKEIHFEPEPSVVPPARSPLAKLRTPNAHRSRSLTLPPKAPKIEGIEDEDLDDDLSTVAFDADDTPLPTSPARPIHIVRPSSNPIHIGSALPRSSRRESDSMFPMTDGAMAEYAALASTPASNPGLLI